MFPAIPSVLGSDSEAAGQLLRRLFWLRNLAVLGQGLAIAAVHFGLDMALPLAPMLVLVGLLALANLAAAWRLRQPWPASGAEALSQLLFDIVILSAQLYLSGGYSNPFVSLLLLPVILAAAALPAALAWATAAVAVAAYAVLGFVFLPLPAPPGLDAFNLHLIGMGFNFALSAALVVWFVARLGASLRQRERELAAAREKAVRDEGVFALGMLAAGAAHELSTPLATLALTADELAADYGDDPELGPSLAVLKDQTGRCKALLTRLTTSAGVGRDAPTLALDEWLAETVEHWRLMRPRVNVACTWQGERPALAIRPEPSLAQALVSLYNNAADTSTDVEIAGHWTADTLTVQVLDRGPGPAPETAEAFASSKGPGRGFGLALARAAVERLGGDIALAARPGGGSVATVRLPLARLSEHVA